MATYDQAGALGVLAEQMTKQDPTASGEERRKAAEALLQSMRELEGRGWLSVEQDPRGYLRVSLGELEVDLRFTGRRFQIHRVEGRVACDVELFFNHATGAFQGAALPVAPGEDPKFPRRRDGLVELAMVVAQVLNGQDPPSSISVV